MNVATRTNNMRSSSNGPPTTKTRAASGAAKNTNSQTIVTKTANA